MGVILNKLSGERVFDVVVLSDGKSVCFTEAGNYCYSERLSKSELKQLIAELSEIESKLIE